jgi:hypothetical protein
VIGLLLLQVYNQVLQGGSSTYINGLVASIMSEKSALENAQLDKDLVRSFNQIGGVSRCFRLE